MPSSAEPSEDETTKANLAKGVTEGNGVHKNSAHPYRMYIATSIALVAVLCSVSQLDVLSHFGKVFSSTLCSSNVLKQLDEGENLTSSRFQFSPFSSTFDPLLKEGDTYDAVKAMDRR